MTQEQQIDKELNDWHLLSKNPMSAGLRQWMLDDIEKQQSVEPETERRDYDPKHISDCQLFLLWLRS